MPICYSITWKCRSFTASFSFSFWWCPPFIFFYDKGWVCFFRIPKLFLLAVIVAYTRKWKGIKPPPLQVTRLALTPPVPGVRVLIPGTAKFYSGATQWSQRRLSRGIEPWRPAECPYVLSWRRCSPSLDYLCWADPSSPWLVYVELNWSCLWANWNIHHQFIRDC